MNICFFLSGGILLIIFGLNLGIGKNSVITPLLETDLRRSIKYNLVFCWYLTCIMQVGLAGLFLWSAFNSDYTSPALYATCFCLAFGAMGWILLAISRQPLTELPQPAVYTFIASTAMLGF